jgi:hypothetical protein
MRPRLTENLGRRPRFFAAYTLGADVFSEQSVETARDGDYLALTAGGDGSVKATGIKGADTLTLTLTSSGRDSVEFLGTTYPQGILTFGD